MKLGLLTATLSRMEMKHIAAWAPQNRYKALEVAAWPVGRKHIHQAAHLNVAQFTTGDAAGVRDLMDQHHLAISAITYCDNNLHHDLAERARTRVVIAVGEESEGTLTARTSTAAAELLGRQAAVFPSHHGGFAGGEFGYAGKPEEFAHRLRGVLDGAIRSSNRNQVSMFDDAPRQSSSAGSQRSTNPRGVVASTCQSL